MAKSRNNKTQKLGRSEVVTIRLDPRLKFGADMAAAKCRRTLSSFTEWAIEEALKKPPFAKAWKKRLAALKNQSLNDARRMARSIPF
jgi:predicted transcriptional regulator